MCGQRGDLDDCATATFQEVLAPGVAEQGSGASAGAVTGRYLGHTERFELVNRLADAGFGLQKEMEPSHEEADRFSSLSLRFPHDVHYAGVGTTGHDHQPLITVHD